MPNSERLRRIVPDLALRRGAHNAVSNSLGVTPEDTVTLVCDDASATVAASLLQIIDEKRASARVFWIERLWFRPLEKLPAEIFASLETSTVSIYTAQPHPGESRHRLEIVEKVGPLGLRHAHMVRITEDAMKQGMLSDYRRVARLNELMISRMRSARRVRVTSRKGTDVQVKLSPIEAWESSAGIIGKGEWFNLPSGEILTCPGSVDGVFVCDALPPLEDEVRTSAMVTKPLHIELQAGRLVSITGGAGDIAHRVEAGLKAAPEMDRIGLFAVGTNFELLMPIGDVAQDLLIPGAYFAFGRVPVNKKTRWSTGNLLPFSGRRVTLELDGDVVIREGRYAPEILSQTGAFSTMPPPRVAN